MFRDVFGSRSKWEKLYIEAFSGKRTNRGVAQSAFFDQERVIESRDLLPDDTLEFPEIADHVALGANLLKVICADSDFNFPAMPVEVLAFAMIIGKKMRRVEKVLRLQFVQCVPFVISA